MAQKQRLKFPEEKSSGTKQIFSTDVEGKTLYVKLNVKHKNLFHLDFLSTVFIKVYVPEKKYESLQVQNEYGSIKMNQLNLKNLTAITKNGEMSFNHINATNVKFQSIENGPITFHGDIHGKLTEKTHNGKISLYTPNLNYPIQLETYNGAISIQT